MIESKKSWEDASHLLSKVDIRLFHWINRFCNITRVLDWRNASAMFEADYQCMLDLGCGKGTSFRHYHKVAGFTVGLDRSRYDLKYAKKTKERVKARHSIGLVCADACSLPFDDETFDLVFSNCVIEHIADDDAVFSETARCLRPGGDFIATLPNSEGQASGIKRWLFGKPWGRRFASQEIQSYFGFQSLKEAEEWLNIHRWDQVRRGYVLVELKERLSHHGLEVTEFGYYHSSWILELWDLATFTRLNDFVPFNFLICGFLFHLLGRGRNEGSSFNSGVIAIKARKLR